VYIDFAKAPMSLWENTSFVPDLSAARQTILKLADVLRFHLRPLVFQPLELEQSIWKLDGP